jgi:hypothetical protein
MKLNPKASGSLYGRGLAKNKKQAGSGDDDLTAAKGMNTRVVENFVHYGVK